MRLYDGFANLNKETMANILATLSQLNLGNLIIKKVGGMIEREDKLQQSIENLKNGLMTLPDEELFLRLLFNINKPLAVPVRNYASVRDIEDNCRDIEQTVIQLEKSVNKKEGGSIQNFDDFLKIQMKEMLSNIYKQFDDFKNLDEKQKQDFLVKFKEFVGSLPSDQQEKIKQTLKVEELSETTLKNALINGSIMMAFAAVVEVAGFSFFMAAVTFFASAASLIGITLPFAFYTGLTSMIAILSNPIFIILALGGGGFWLVKKQNKKIMDKLIPIIVMQIGFSTYAKNDNIIKIDTIPSYFKSLYEVKQQILAGYNVNIAKIRDLNGQINSLKAALTQENQILEENQQLYAELVTLNAKLLDNTAVLDELKTHFSYKEAVNKILGSKEKLSKAKSGSFFKDLLKSGVDYLAQSAIELNLKSILEQIIKTNAYALIKNVLREDSFKNLVNKRNAIASIREQVNRLENDLSILNAEKDSITRENQDQGQCLKNKDMDYPGFSSLFVKEKP